MSAKSETKIKEHKYKKIEDKQIVQVNESSTLKIDEKPVRICLYGDPGVGKTTLANKLKEIIAKNDVDTIYQVEIFEMQAVDTVKPPSKHFKPNLKIEANLIFMLFDLSAPQDEKLIKNRRDKIKAANLSKPFLVGTKCDSPHADNKKLYTLEPKHTKFFYYSVSAEKEIHLVYLLQHVLNGFTAEKARAAKIKYNFDDY